MRPAARLPGTVGGPCHLLGMDIRWCGDCKDERTFEMPPCEDGHGDDCLDLACGECGFAIVLGRHDDAIVPELVAA